MILPVIFNPLLYALRGTRNGLTLISSKILRNASLDGPSDFSSALKNGVLLKSQLKRVSRENGEAIDKLCLRSYSYFIPPLVAGVASILVLGNRIADS